jgi:hypothetical protein
MSMGFATAHEATDHNHTAGRSRLIGDWEVHTWGGGRLPGMAAVSAIATLQLGATLTDVPEDKVALNKAAEYLTKALAPQLKAFQQGLAAS